MLPLQLQIFFLSSNGQIIKTNVQIFKITIQLKCQGHVVTAFPLFSPRGAYLISNVFLGGWLNRGRGLIKF